MSKHYSEYTEAEQHAAEERVERKEHFLKIIEEWQGYWMNQTQNSEEDRQNYFRRAFGVDANMRHHLARMLAEDLGPVDSKGEPK